MKYMNRIRWLLLGAALTLTGTEVRHLTPADWNNQGSVFYATSAYGQAQQCFEEALRLTVKEKQVDTAELSTILFNLAAVYRAQARYHEAEGLYFRSLALQNERSRPALLRIWNGLTLLYLNEGELSKAEAAGKKALTIRAEDTRCPGERVDAMNNLALVFLTEHREQEAEQLTRAILSDKSAVCEELSLQRGTAYDTLGRVRFRSRDYVSAEEDFEQAARLMEKSVGPHSAFAASVWNDLGRVKAAKGQWSEAERLLKHAITTLEEIYGDEHPEVAASFSGLAEFYQERKRYTKAEVLFERALAIDEKTVGAVSQKVAKDLNNLGSLAFREHHWDQAGSLFSRSLAIYIKTQGPKGADAGTVDGNLAVLYWRQQRFSEAEPLFQRAVAIREAYFGQQDSVLANLLFEYALTLRSDKHYAEAALAEARATKIKVRNSLRSE